MTDGNLYTQNTDAYVCKLDEIEKDINNKLKKIQDEKTISDGIFQAKFNQFESKHNSLAQEVISNRQNSMYMLSYILGIIYSILLNPVVRFINKFTHTYVLGIREINTMYFGKQYILLVSNRKTATVENQTVFNKKYKELLKSGRKTKYDIIDATIKYQMGGYEIHDNSI